LIKVRDPRAELVCEKKNTKKDKKQFLTSGGRVLNVTAIGNTLEHSLEKAYNVIDSVNFKGKQFRRDIGRKFLKDSPNIVH